MPLPSFESSGDLPVGLHRAGLEEVVSQLGQGSPRRILLSQRLRRIYELAADTGHLRRFLVFGSFVSAVAAPNDVDVFLVMNDTFDVTHVQGEALTLFNHAGAQAYFGASIFWLRRATALGGEDAAIEQWQIKRDGSRRGIVEVVGQ